MTAMRPNRLPHIVNGMLLLLLFGGSLWVYPSLPEQIPVGTSPGEIHYGEATLFNWLQGPFFVVLMMGFVYAVTLGTMRVPLAPGVSFSNRKTYEQLSRDHRKRIARRLRTAMYWTGTGMSVCFIGIQVEYYLLAIGIVEDSVLAGWEGGLGVTLVFLVGILTFDRRLARHIDRLAEAERSE